MQLPAELWAIVLVATPRPLALVLTCRMLADLFRQKKMAWFARHVTFNILRRLVQHLEHNQNVSGLKVLLRCIKCHRETKWLRAMLIALVPYSPGLRELMPGADVKRLMTATPRKRNYLLFLHIFESLIHLKSRRRSLNVACQHSQTENETEAQNIARVVRWPVLRLSALFDVAKCTSPAAGPKLLLCVIFDMMPWHKLTDAEHIELLNYACELFTVRGVVGRLPRMVLSNRLGRDAAFAWLEHQIWDTIFMHEMYIVLNEHFEGSPEPASAFGIHTTACFELVVAMAVKFGSVHSLIFALCMPRFKAVVVVQGSFLRRCIHATQDREKKRLLQNFHWQNCTLHACMSP